MIEIIWEFVVREEARVQFELAYGPGGAWSNLVARSPGFRGATLLRDTKNARRYLRIGLWDSAARQEQIPAEHTAEDSSPDMILEDLIESKTEVGTFRVMAEATVQPRGRAGRTKAGGARRRSRRATR